MLLFGDSSASRQPSAAPIALLCMKDEARKATGKRTRFSEHIDERVDVLRAGGRLLVDIANDVGTSTAELFQWRTGLRPVPWQRARRLAEVLGTTPELVSLDYLEMQAVTSESAPPKDAQSSRSMRPDPQILLATVQISVELLLKKQAPLTADDVMSSYDLAVRRLAERDRATPKAERDESESRRSPGVSSDNPRPKRARSR